MSNRNDIADAFGRSLDPLAEENEVFNQSDLDPFEDFLEMKAERREAGTVKGYRVTINHYTEFMETTDRHPATPTPENIVDFGLWLRDERGNADSTIRNKLGQLNAIYQEWQDDPAFPHTDAYNPIRRGRKKLNLNIDRVDSTPKITVEQLRSDLSDVNHIRDKAIIATQIKLGLRAGEVRNLKLKDVHLANVDAIKENYPELGTHDAVTDFPNAIYVSHERDGNKSKRPRVLPLDEEMRQTLVDYLLIRPDVDSTYLFLGKETATHMAGSQDISRAWQNQGMQYDETKVSHFGRHFFTTYWKIDQDLPREYVRWMRGDKIDDEMDALSHYLHAHYEDIEPLYRKQIFDLYL